MIPEKTYSEEASQVFSRLKTWSLHALYTVDPDAKVQVELDITNYVSWLRMNNRTSNTNALRDWVAALEDVSIAGATRAIESLRTLMIREGPRHPVYSLKIGRKPRKIETQAATAEQFAIMLPIVALQHGEPNRDNRLAMYLMWYAGMAMVDACNLKWKAVNIRDGYISGTRSKTESRYTVPLLPSEPLLALLTEYHGEAGENVDPEDYVSHVLAMRYQMSRTSLKSKITTAGRYAGLAPGNASHALRRGFITRLIASGVSDTMLSQMTGHSNTASLRQYHKPTVAELRGVLQAAHDNASGSGQSVTQGMPAAGPPRPVYQPPTPHRERNSGGRWTHKESGGLPECTGQLG